MIHRFVAAVGESRHAVSVERLEDDRFRVTIGDRSRVVIARALEPGLLSLLPEGGGSGAVVDVEGGAPDYVVTVRGRTAQVKLEDGRGAAVSSPTRAAKGPAAVRSPMPGKVVKVLVREGEVVPAGHGVAIVEAMKMENELRAPREGSVVAVAVREGDAVEAGQTLVTIG